VYVFVYNTVGLLRGARKVTNRANCDSPHWAIIPGYLFVVSNTHSHATMPLYYPIKECKRKHEVWNPDKNDYDYSCGESCIRYWINNGTITKETIFEFECYWNYYFVYEAECNDICFSLSLGGSADEAECLDIERCMPAKYFLWE
jgi:hypothetical protein